MEKFYIELEKIISKNCYLEEYESLAKYKETNVLVVIFGLIIILDNALMYSNKKDIVNDNFERNYINKIFNFELLKDFDDKFINDPFIRQLPYVCKSLNKSILSFQNYSRLGLWSNIIKNQDQYILKEYPNNKLKDSIKMRKFINNSSPSDFFKEKDVADFLFSYVSTMDVIFRNFFNTILEFNIRNLQRHHVLSNLVKDLSNFNLPEENFSSPEKFFETVDSFISLCVEKRLSKYKKDELSKFTKDEYDLKELLVDLLFTDINLEDYSKINIYDQFYSSKETLDKAKEFINSQNTKCHVNLYHSINIGIFSNLSAQNFLTLLQSLLYEGNMRVSSKKIDAIFSNDLNAHSFDFIISDCRGNDISADDVFIHKFQDRIDKPLKLVMIIEKDQFYNKYINWMIKNDNLEALLVFDLCFILIANSNKSLKRKNRFILIDYNILNDLHGDYKPYIHNGFFYSGIGRYSKRLVSKMLKIYNDFEDSEFSKVITNETVVKNFVYDELDKYWGDYYNNPLEKLIESDHDGNLDILETYNKKLKNVPNEVLLKSKDYYEKSYPIINIKYDSNKIVCENQFHTKRFNRRKKKLLKSRRYRSIDFYLKDFNYNNLMYDKLNKPYTIYKQNKIRGNKSNIVEETFNLIPLYSLITFNPLDLDEKEIEERRLCVYDEIFYLKSDKFLKKFIEYYLESGKGTEDYWFFKDNNMNGSKKHFVYIRIPIIPLETQEKIIKAYELNEEHYNLVKQKRDNFLKDILDYDRLLKDMENFNDMEIDVKTGQIKKMSTAKRHLLDGLLWPLSISYLNAVHGTHADNPNEKLDFYLKLFEFLAAFIDIVLVSAMPKEEYEKQKQELWDGVFFNATKDKQGKVISIKHKYRCLGDFGTWTTLYAKLLKCYKEQDITPTFSNELIKSFLDDDIYEIIDMAREIRNKHPGHGPGVSQSLAKNLIEDLKGKIDLVYEIFGYLNGFKFFYCEDDRCKIIDNNNFKYSVVSLNGPCDQPIYGEITFNKTLKKDTLYLSNSLNGDLLELNSNLIIFDEAIDMYEEYDKSGEKHIKTRPSGRYYLYVFNGFNKRKKKYKVNYKCHQIYTTEKLKEFSFDTWNELLPIK